MRTFAVLALAALAGPAAGQDKPKPTIYAPRGHEVGERPVVPAAGGWEGQPSCDFRRLLSEPNWFPKV